MAEAKLHWLHLWGFSPVCVFKWSIRWIAWENSWLHWLHLWGFSAQCVFKCFFIFDACDDVYSHWLHLCGLSPMCLFKCFFLGRWVFAGWIYWSITAQCQTGYSETKMKNVEIGFETSVFHTKDKTTRQLLLYFRQQLKKKEQKVKVTISTSRQKNFNTTSSKHLRHNYIVHSALFPSKWLNFPPHLVVRNTTTWLAAVQVVRNLTIWWEIWPPRAVKIKNKN